MREVVVSGFEASAKVELLALRDAVTSTAEYFGPEAPHGEIGVAAADSHCSDVAPR
jgi:hypothetical protein